MKVPSPSLEPITAAGAASVLSAGDLPYVPGRVLPPAELLGWVQQVAAADRSWSPYVSHDTSGRHFVSLYRDSDVDLWLLCWNLVDDTGWHDHDTSSGAVAVTRGAVVERRLRLGAAPESQVVSAGQAFSFGPDRIHRMAGARNGSVSVHAYSPPLWRMGQYSINPDGFMQRYSVSYADELRPQED